MEKTFRQERELEAFKKWKQFDRIRRNEGEDVRAFSIRFNTDYDDVARMGITIKDRMRAFMLMEKAMISEELE